jgi:hypothetical protein
MDERTRQELNDLSEEGNKMLSSDSISEVALETWSTRVSAALALLDDNASREVEFDSATDSRTAVSDVLGVLAAVLERPRE